jgi:hypothetical protein
MLPLLLLLLLLLLGRLKLLPTSSSPFTCFIYVSVSFRAVPKNKHWDSVTVHSVQLD